MHNESFVSAREMARQEDSWDAYQCFAREFSRDLESLVARAVALVLDDLPEYVTLTRSEGIDQLASNFRVHLQVVRDIAYAGNVGAPPDSDFAYRASAARAAQGLSIEAVLRSSQFVTQIVWAWLMDNPNFGALRDQVIRNCWPIWLDYVDHMARATAAAYVAVAETRARQDSRAKRNLLEQLVHGRLTSLEASRSMRAIGFSDDKPFRMALLRWWDVGEDETFDVLEHALRTANNSLERAIGVRPLSMIQETSLVVVAQCVDTETGKIRDQLRSVASNPINRKFRISGAISGPVSDLATLHEVHAHLSRATSVSRYEGAISFTSDISLLGHAIGAMHDFFARVCPDDLKSFITANPKSTQLWQETLESYARHNLSVRETAAELHVHPNTVYYRLNQIGSLAGRDTSTLQGFLDVLIALRLRSQLTESGEPGSRPAVTP